VIDPPLACTVRDCGLFLEARGRTLQCARRHSYDIARAGYVNLLQPHDRRSLTAGDTRDALDARARLLAAGVGRLIAEGIVGRAARLAAANDVIADLGSGSGDILSMLSAAVDAGGIGIDLSTAAAEHAARRFPGLTWVVANADRGLPLLDRSIDLLISVNGRRNPGECARVLTVRGHLLVAVPAPDDLIELRTAIFGEAVTRDRMDTVIGEHAPHFSVADRFTLREQHQLGRAALGDVLLGTYRGMRRAAAPRLDALARLGVTFASEVVVFGR
jgi:23S rRNA (guanine745-N1)-methyltransferase